MALSTDHTPVILLLKNGQSADAKFVRDWLGKSSYTTVEAFDAFELLESMSDFTVRERPDVFIVNVDSPSGELSAIRQIVGGSAGCIDPAIIAVSDVGGSAHSDDFYACDVSAVKARLETLIPAGANRFNN